MPAKGESVGVKRPDLIPLWSSNNPTSVFDCSAGSAKTVLWICSKSHEFSLRVSRMVDSSSSPCPYCNGKKASPHNNITLHNPETAIYFHPTKNTLPATDFLSASSQKVWWRCIEYSAHEWLLSPKNMVKRRLKCNFCADKELSATNSLAIKRPELAAEFDKEKNQTTPDQVIANQSKVSYWWKCEAFGHSWEARLDSRINHAWGCPYCANRYASPQNNLLVNFPEIAQEFDSEANGCKPEDIIGTTDTHYAWKCKDGHQWKTAVSTRTVMGTGCPYCVNQRVHAKNSLAYLYPEIAKEYDPDNEVLATDVGGGSAKIVSWICDKNHSWKAAISSRTFAKTGCPKCVRTSVSAVEKAFRAEFANRKILTSISSEALDIPWRKSKFLRPDFHGEFNKRKVVVEYDGSYFHQNRHERDIQKSKALIEEGWIVIRIREQTANLALDDLDYTHNNFFQLKHQYRKDDAASIRETTDKIYRWLNSMA